jgi:hypothetical protein
MALGAFTGMAILGLVSVGVLEALKIKAGIFFWLGETVGLTGIICY